MPCGPRHGVQHDPRPQDHGQLVVRSEVGGTAEREVSRACIFQLPITKLAGLLNKSCASRPSDRRPPPVGREQIKIDPNNEKLFFKIKPLLLHYCRSPLREPLCPRNVAESTCSASCRPENFYKRVAFALSRQRPDSVRGSHSASFGH